MLFQSVGSQYNFRKSLAILFAKGSAKSREELKNKLSSKYSGKAILFSKGRAALSVAISLATVNSDKKKVIVTGFTCYSVVQAIRKADCEEIYVDINRNDLNFDINALEKTVQENNDIGAIIIQNTLGIPTINIEQIETLAKNNDIKIIEDLAHCAGGSYNDGREIGTIGNYTMLSFGRGKSIDSVNGGALVIKDKEDIYLEPVKRVRDTRDRWYPILSYLSRKTFRIGLGKILLAIYYKTGLFIRSADGDVNVDESMPNWQASVALKEINGLSELTKKRNDVASFATKAISNNNIPGKDSVFKSYIRIPVIVKDKDKIISAMKKNHIFIDDTWYRPAVSPERFYHLAKFDESKCPNAVDIAKNIINLPTNVSTNDKLFKKAIEIINNEQ